MAELIDKMKKDIENGAPGVSNHVVDSGKIPVKRVKGKPEKGKTDKHGRYFDKDIHQTNKDGTPRINKEDGFISIKQGAWNRKHVESPKSEIARPLKEVPDASPGPEIKPEPVKTSIMTPEIAGKIAADHTFLIGVLIGGEDWKPIINAEMGINEQDFITQAYTAYFRAAGIIEIPPGWMLIIALSSYAIPRFTMPRTKTRLVRAGQWIKNKAGRIFKHGARLDTGDDREREDDAGKSLGAVA
jgi:hypothetical protein